MPITPTKPPDKLARNTMSFSAFCAHLGAPMNNIRNSWCGYSSERRRAVFTVWDDEIHKGRYVFWEHAGAPHQSKIGAKDLKRVLDAVIASGGEALGVICYAADVHAEPRVRARFSEDRLLLLQLVDEGNEIFGRVVGEVLATDALRGRVTSFSPLRSALDDLDTPPVGFVEVERTEVHTYVYSRDDAVRQFVLRRAAGRCEYCGELGFLTSAGTNYLEAHHIIRLASQGPDTVTNVIALCPNHHREAHYGNAAAEFEVELQQRLRSISAKK